MYLAGWSFIASFILIKNSIKLLNYYDGMIMERAQIPTRCSSRAFCEQGKNIWNACILYLEICLQIKVRDGLILCMQITKTIINKRCVIDLSAWPVSQPLSVIGMALAKVDSHLIEHLLPVHFNTLKLIIVHHSHGLMRYMGQYYRPKTTWIIFPISYCLCLIFSYD